MVQFIYGEVDRMIQTVIAMATLYIIYLALGILSRLEYIMIVNLLITLFGNYFLFTYYS